MIACCGLDCDVCPARIATISNNDVLRAQTAKTWSEQFGAAIAPADIQCDGCSAVSGRQFRHCAVCEIRSCSTRKNHTTCAECADYPCGKLNFIFEYEPAAKTRLDALVRK